MKTTLNDLMIATLRREVGWTPEIYIRRKASAFEDELVIQDRRGEGYFVVLTLDARMVPEELLCELDGMARKYRNAAFQFHVKQEWPRDRAA